MAALAPVPFVGEHSEDDLDLFGDFRWLYPIVVEGRPFAVPEANSVLRALQYVELKHGAVALPWHRYCWNDSTGCCEMTYRPEASAAPRPGRACVVQAAPGLEIVVLPKGARSCSPP